MQSKFVSMTRGALSTVDVDQIGLQMWGMGVLAIGLSFAIRLDNQSAMLLVILRGAFVAYLTGLTLIALGLLDILWTRFRTIRNGSQARQRYARPALLPLWYHVYGAPRAGRGARAHRWAALRFDHGQAWAWGTECLIMAGIVETALMLAHQHPLWHNVGTLAILAVVRTTLVSIRRNVAAHGHG